MDKKECKFCDRVWGVFGVATGALIMLIGLDLLSGGLVSKLIGKPIEEIESSEEESEDADDE